MDPLAVLEYVAATPHDQAWRVGAHHATGSNIPLAELTATVARVRDAATAAGRDPAGFPIVCRGSFNLMAEP